VNIAKIRLEEALKMDEKGFVSYQEDLCTFCGICAASCPYNYLAIGKLKGKEILLKCDLCNGDPQCVRYCTPEALQLVERTPDQEARKNMLTKHRMAKLREVL
jgi:Fe-S-cluster-containing hydrogenase component 2